jgi:signal peptidase I
MITLITVASVAGLSPLLIRPFVLEAFQIPSGAMIPTLLVGDHIFVKKWQHHPEPGDVIVFKYPLDPSTDYVKRVVAVGGDVVEMKGEELFVNGKAVARKNAGEACPDGVPAEDSLGLKNTCEVWEETLGRHTFRTLYEPGRGARDFERKVVPPNALFVMGDNRDNSSDSRVWGTVPLDNVKGVVWRVWWSRDPETGRVRSERINSTVR